MSGNRQNSGMQNTFGSGMQNGWGQMGNNNRFNGSYNPYQSHFGFGQDWGMNGYNPTRQTAQNTFGGGQNAMQNPQFNSGGNQTIGTSPSGQLSFTDPTGMGVGNTQSSYSQPQNSTVTGNTFVDPNGVGVNGGYTQPAQPPQQTYGGTAGVDPVTGRYVFY
jgi:hypothetical protein